MGERAWKAIGDRLQSPCLTHCLFKQVSPQENLKLPNHNFMENNPFSDDDGCSTTQEIPRLYGT
jgi:hypothetical protein